MSSDTGIYILETIGAEYQSEYRVAYHMAVENYQWDDKLRDYSDNPDVWIKNAREMWKDCKVFTSRDEALKEADKQYQEFMKDEWAVLEYGISFIYIPRKFV